jgi:hypothetical protein
MYFWNLPTSQKFDDQCSKADADIVGDGVRAATWTQVVFLALIAVIGTYGADHSAIQEVGAGLLVTQSALAIALLVPVAQGTLFAIDSILGTMILDAQNSALSIQLVAEETLASRWQTGTVISGKLAGLAAIGVLMNNSTNNGLATTETCKCVSVFWWGWLSNCAEVARDDHQAVWTYYAVRAITALQSCITAGLYTGSFDRAKKTRRGVPMRKVPKVQRHCNNGKQPRVLPIRILHPRQDLPQLQHEALFRLRYQAVPVLHELAAACSM